MADCHWQTSRGDTICISADNVVSHLDYLLEHVRRLLSLCACVHIAQHRALRPPPDRRRALKDYIIIGYNRTGVCANNQGSCPSDLKRKNGSVDFCWFSCFPLIWSPLLLFALNVLMLLVGVNGTPGSDYLSAPLTNSISDVYTSTLYTHIHWLIPLSYFAFHCWLFKCLFPLSLSVVIMFPRQGRFNLFLGFTQSAKNAPRVPF